MKGERTTARLGVKTNKTIKRDPWRGTPDYKVEQFIVKVENKVMHNDTSIYCPTKDDRVIQKPLCSIC